MRRAHCVFVIYNASNIHITHLTGNDTFRQAGDVDTAIAVLRMRSSALAILSGTRHDPLGYDVRLELFGSKDSVVAGLDERAPIRSLDGPGTGQNGYANFLDRFGPSYRAELAAFVEVARSERESPCTGAEAREALRISVAASVSLRERRPVALEEIS